MALPLPDKPSVAVLPFDLQSNGEGDAAFAEVMGDDLTRGLGRIPDLFVIARSSASRFAASDATPAEAAEALGVAHVVRGAVRRSGDRVRLDVEMIDALSGRIIWSERFDRASQDLFALQDELVGDIATRLAQDLRRIAEQPRFTTWPEAYLLWAQADHQSWINSPESYAEAEALALDPNFHRAEAVLVFVQTQRGWFRLVEDREAVLQKALADAEALAEAAPDDWFMQVVHAQTLLNAGRYAEAAERYESVLAQEPGSIRLLTRAALPKIFLGSEDSAPAGGSASAPRHATEPVPWLADGSAAGTGALRSRTLRRAGGSAGSGPQGQPRLHRQHVVARRRARTARRRRGRC